MAEPDKSRDRRETNPPLAAGHGARDPSDARERLEAETTYVFEPEPPRPRPRGALRSFVDELFFAGVGAVALTKERVDELVDELAGRGELTRDEARDVVEGVTARWRGETARLGERTSVGLAGMLRELGLVTRREWEDLELRLSQVEHRLRLVEREQAAAPAPAREERRRSGGARRGV